MNLSGIGWAVSRVGVYLLAGTLFLPSLAWAQAGSVGQPAGQDAAPLATGAGLLKKAAFFSLNDPLDNNSTVYFVDAFNVPVTTAGLGTQCVLIQYSSEMALLAASDPASGSFRTLLDGVLMEGHSYFQQNAVFAYGTAVTRFDMVGFHHWKCGVAAGVHTIQVQFKPAIGMNQMLVRGRSLTVQFKR